MGPACETCAPGFSGAECQVQCNAAQDCNSEGICAGTGECSCFEDASSADCTTCAKGRYGPSCEIECAAGDTCGKHGRCETDGSCVCESGFFDRRFVLALRCVVAGATPDEPCVITFS